MTRGTSLHLFGGRFQIFGTMDGFSLVKWAVKVENPINAAVCCRLFVRFLDKQGEIINASREWAWFPGTYSQQRCLQTDNGLMYHLNDRITEISGTVKTAAKEADTFADIDFRIEQVI